MYIMGSSYIRSENCVDLIGNDAKGMSLELCRLNTRPNRHNPNELSTDHRF